MIYFLTEGGETILAALAGLKLGDAVYSIMSKKIAESRDEGDDIVAVTYYFHGEFLPRNRFLQLVRNAGERIKWPRRKITTIFCIYLFSSFKAGVMEKEYFRVTRQKRLLQKNTIEMEPILEMQEGPFFLSMQINPFRD
jgi:hypothetical protein